MTKTVDLNDLASIGVIRDQPPYQLPPEAWSLMENVRLRDDSVERLLGWEQVFGTPFVAPHFLMALSTAAQQFWLYVSLTKAATFDGTSHQDATRAVGGDYTVTETRDWNGTILGGIPIFNNGADVPQMWTPPAAATNFANLTNWVSTARARVIRSLGPFLIAFGLTDSGTVKPHLVRWGHPADPGSVPSSWDVTDPTKDTGEVDLPDVNSGIILDALPLQGVMYIYKEGSIWRQTLVGGSSIFDFKTFLETAGILTQRCVTVTGDGLHHVVATQDDILIHNGNKADSVLSKRMKKSLFAQIDTVSYKNSFMFTNAAFDEVWFCYPSNGQTHPDRALVWNYKAGEMGGCTEVQGINFRNASIGAIEAASDETWAQDAENWNQDTTLWSTLERRRVVVCGTGATKFYGLDSGTTRDGTEFDATVQRTGLAIIGKKRNGEWIVDHEIRKVVTRIWPKVRTGQVRVRVGFQDLVDGPVTWKDYFAFDPTTGTANPAQGMTVDMVGSGRAVAVEFTDADTPEQWSLDGYKVELATAGRF